jgi:hypothetical protein
MRTLRGSVLGLGLFCTAAFTLFVVLGYRPVPGVPQSLIVKTMTVNIFLEGVFYQPYMRTFLANFTIHSPIFWSGVVASMVVGGFSTRLKQS